MKLSGQKKVLQFLVSIAFLFSGGSLMAATGAEMKACEIAVLEKPKFQDLPMAAVSVYPGKDAKHAHWSIRWDGLKAEGGCKIGKHGGIASVHVKQLHDNRGKHHGDKHKNNKDREGGDDLDGFYYDRHVNEWRDPGGRICHTCTPENGFPDHGSKSQSKYVPKNHFEKQMQHDMRNMLSDEDIKNLNALGN
ncbi:MAG: hypothetical protein ACR2QL_11960 [Woeseiaceae bacterium]